MMTLDKLEIGQSAKVSVVGGDGPLRKYLLEMGIIPGQVVTLTKFAPLGDPMEIQINGYSLSLRKADAAKIELISIDSQPLQKENKIEIENIFVHPGYGEGGKYHNKKHENPLPENTKLSYAIIGNPHSGKVSLYNRLIDNKNHDSLYLIPDIYSLSTHSYEDLLSSHLFKDNRPTAIINVVDASNLRRSLYLTMQLMELEIPVVLALNMIDILQENGGSIRVNMMEQALGLPVVPISALKNEGIEELMSHATHIAKYQETPLRQDFCDKDEDGAIHRCLHSIMHIIEAHSKSENLPVRFAAIRIIENDESVIKLLNLSKIEKEAIENIIVQMEEELGLDRLAAIAQMRFSFINKLCSKTLVQVKENKEFTRSQKIDKLLTGHFFSIYIFIAIMCLILWVSIDLLGSPLQKILSDLIQKASTVCDTALENLGVALAVRSLVSDGIFTGVGTVLSFIPIILLLFFFLSYLEDSGYLSRVAFMSDKAMRKIGLSGRSIVPLLTGFGCSVPAIMSTRTLTSARDRKMTISLIPYISCSAKIPIYAFVSSSLFPGKGGLILVCLYLLAIFVGVIVAFINSKISSKDNVAPFVMELPNYRMPAFRNVMKLIWSKAQDFIKQALTLILLASIVIWFLQSFDFRLNMVESQYSILASIAGLITPLFAPIGLGDWRIVTALISGFMAKETVVSTLQVLGGVHILTQLTAIPLLVFCLLYTPCIASIGTIKNELGRKSAIFTIIFQCLVAWICAFIAYLFAGFFL